MQILINGVAVTAIAIVLSPAELERLMQAKPEVSVDTAPATPPTPEVTSKPEDRVGPHTNIAAIETPYLKPFLLALAENNEAEIRLASLLKKYPIFADLSWSYITKAAKKSKGERRFWEKLWRPGPQTGPWDEWRVIHPATLKALRAYYRVD